MFSPSYINTNLSRAALTGTGQAYGKNEEDIRKGMSAEYVAEQILYSLKEKKEEVHLGPLAHLLAVYLRPILPWLYFRIIANKASKEAKSIKNEWFLFDTLGQLWLLQVYSTLFFNNIFISL